MERTTVVLSKDDYRDFTNNVATLQEQGYDMPHEVQYLEDEKFEVTVFGDHDWDALDEVMERSK